ncbi:MAG: glycosyltransferase 87 family protein [Oligoflexia bacterium]|nr:glycosyltransferase 87 family protein [Oligoflexia bacterium]
MRALGGLILALSVGYLIGMLLGGTLITPDFLSLYMPIRALALGNSVYDLSAQLSVVEELKGLGITSAGILAPAYPPSTYLLLSVLGKLGPLSAAKVWFSVNFATLAIALNLLTNRLSPLMRGLRICASLFFAPLIGVLVLGQFDLPVLLGLSLSLLGIKHTSRIWLLSGTLLLLFKPHIALPSLGICLYLLWRFSPTANERLRAFSPILFFLAIPIFSEQANWRSYADSLRVFSRESHVVECHACSSLPRFVSEVGFLPGDSVQILGIILSVAFLLTTLRNLHAKNSDTSLREQLFLLSIALTPLISGYFRNYDFVVLLVPLIAASIRSTKSMLLALAIGACISWSSLYLAALIQSAILLLASSFLALLIIYTQRLTGALEQ